MTVQFPGLGIELDIDRVAFSIGGISIYWYAIIIMSGFALAVLYAFRRSKYFGIEKDPMFDVVLIGFVCSIIGARLYYVIFSGRSYDSLLDVINLRDGGLAIYGAVICAFVSGYISCRWRRIRPMAMFDIAGIGFLIGQGIGRWGNFMNQEAFGGATSLPWGMLSENTMKVVPDSPVHPCFLYESLWCLTGLVILHFLSKKWYKFYGQYFLLYLLWYGLGRSWIEGLRTDSLWLVPDVIRVSQMVAVLSLLTIPLLILGLQGKLFVQRQTDADGNAINAMTAPAAADSAKAPSKKPRTAITCPIKLPFGSKNTDSEQTDKTQED